MFKKEDIRPDADLRDANLIKAFLREANLIGSNLELTDLHGADLSRADLTDAKSLPSIKCPEKGSYVGYKKAKRFGDYFTSVIVTLEVPETAKRSSDTSNKCRCSEAKVLSIESLDGTKKYDKAVSSFDFNFIYKVGEIVKVDDFNDDRRSEYAPGIHHFVNREEAVYYLI